MEEVDQIIIHSLQSIGCDLDKEVNSCRDFDANTFYRVVVRCLSIISPEKEFRKAITGLGMSAKVNACVELTEFIKSMGYKGDLGYHQILYPNEAENRKVLNWLTSQLPRTETEQSGGGVATDSTEVLQNAIESTIKTLLKESWSPFFGVSPNQRNYQNIFNLHTSSIQGPFPTLQQQKDSKTVKAVTQYIQTKQPYVTAQPKRREDVIPSLQEYNYARYLEETERQAEWDAEGLDSGLNPYQFREQKRNRIMKQMGEHIRYSLDESEAAFAKYLTEKEQQRTSLLKSDKATRFKNLVEFTQEESTYTPQESEEDVKKRREEELAVLEEKINLLKSKLEQVKQEMESFQTGIRQNQASIMKEEQKYSTLEERYRIDSKVFNELLPEADKNIQLLQQLSQQSAGRLMELATEWEKHRSKLIDSYRKLKAEHINRKGGSADLLVNIKKMREAIKELEAEVSKKDERYKELLDVYSQLPKNINRAVYTSRILEIVKQVKKQKVDINKILLDTRALQKDINANIETLGRTFSVASEMVYLDAKAEKKDNTAKRVYKELVSIHDKYQELSNKVSEVGTVSNQVLDLEEKMSQVTQRAGGLDLDRILQDCEQMKKENQALMKKLSAM